jgi:hypothetical protein
MLAIAPFGLFAACVSEIPASAQDVVGGSFTLAHEARWNRTVLPAGSYTFIFSTASMPNRMIIINGFSLDLSSAMSYRKIDARPASPYLLLPYLFLGSSLEPCSPQASLLAAGKVEK